MKLSDDDKKRLAQIGYWRSQTSEEQQTKLMRGLQMGLLGYQAGRERRPESQRVVITRNFLIIVLGWPLALFGFVFQLLGALSNWIAQWCGLWLVKFSLWGSGTKSKQDPDSK